MRFLCPVCEDRFSKWEKTFAQQVFHPLHKHQGRPGCTYPAMNGFQHGDWLLRFCVSVSWRSLIDLTMQYKSDVSPFGDGHPVAAAQESWRSFLLGERDAVEGFEQHLMIVGAPSETRGIENSPDLRLYFERAVTNGFWHCPEEAYVVTKLCRVIVVGTVRDEAMVWRGTSVNSGSGYFSAEDQVVSGVFRSWLQNDLDGIIDARTRVSSAQRDLIRESAQEARR